jgi:DNA polymerase IIIc chi subunit
MSQCIFHDIEEDRRDQHLFDIVEQAYQGRARILIFAGNEKRASALDKILWIFKQEAFIPHTIIQSLDGNLEIPVAIVVSEINPIKAQILIADGHCSLDFACTFPLIHEFVTHTTPQILETCRERFRAYRTRRLTVEHIKA